ncbi:MAG: hypothetical protein AB8U88_03865 [Rickettsia conorii subsp. raoultii]|uniref:hypothetical protein n=2 Tax=Rickettsia conorii TaxID=781 RepID=UPI0029CAC2C5|nr:hypothetical protein [Rickettsia conorii]
MTPSNPAGYNTPTTPVTGTGGFGPNGPANVGGNPYGPNALVVTTPTSNVGANQLSTGGGGSFGGTTGYNSPLTGGSSYNSPAATGIVPANSGNSSAQGSSSSLGGTTKGGVTNSGSSPYGNSGNPKATGVSPANNSNGMGSSSGSDMSAIGSSRDNSAGTSSGGSSGSGISRAKANDGFNAAQDNTSIGNQKVRERIKALEDENNNATNPAAEDATSRKRGAAVGGGDCELDESKKANNSIYRVWASLYYGKAVQKKPLTDLAVIKLNLPVAQSGLIPL